MHVIAYVMVFQSILLIANKTYKAIVRIVLLIPLVLYMLLQFSKPYIIDYQAVLT